MQEAFKDPKIMSGICEKCPHFSGCQSLCRPAQIYLSNESLSVWEKKIINSEGEEITILYSRRGETPLSVMEYPDDKAFSTDNDSPFSSFDPALVQTRLFIDRFFFKFSVEDLSVKYDLTRREVTGLIAVVEDSVTQGSRHHLPIRWCLFVWRLSIRFAAYLSGIH